MFMTRHGVESNKKLDELMLYVRFGGTSVVITTPCTQEVTVSHST